jgi:uncharacterized protein YecE (DUF72 family)
VAVSTGRLRVGCSGYAYAEWTGPFYPEGLPASRRLSWYAGQFDSVELNSTHYGTPSHATVEAWTRAVPSDFRFAVKLHRFGTHRKKLADPESWMERSLSPVVDLGRWVGPVLLQLPPRWRPRLDRLDHCLRVLTAAAPRRRRVVEVRDERWIGEDLVALLRRHRTALCHHDLLDVDGLTAPTAPFVYLRFHGPDPRRPYHGSYGTRRLRPVAEQVAALVAAGVDAYAYFNNDVGAAAPDDARRFRELVEELR